MFKQLIGTKDLKKKPVTIENVADAFAIFGSNVNRLKGTSTRQLPPRVVGGRCEILRDFYRLNKFVTLAADVMFVCGFPFLVTYSRSIKYNTAEFIPTRTAEQLAKCLMQVVYGYARGGFVVNIMLMDMEFKKIKELLHMVEVNTTAAREHVTYIEHQIRTIKEHVRSVTSEFPFNPVPMLYARGRGINFYHM